MSGIASGGHSLHLATSALAARQKLRAWLAPHRPLIVGWLRVLARVIAYIFVLLLSAVWLTSATASLTRPLLDLDRPLIGDAIMTVAGLLALPPQGAVQLAQVLIVARILLGTLLLVAMIQAAYHSMRGHTQDDQVLELALLLSAMASLVAGAPVIMDAEPRLAVIGELILCVMASGLVTFGRGPVTAVARVECAIGVKFFNDVLTLIFMDQQWCIISKVFHFDIREERPNSTAS